MKASYGFTEADFLTAEDVLLSLVYDDENNFIENADNTASDAVLNAFIQVKALHDKVRKERAV